MRRWVGVAIVTGVLGALFLVPAEAGAAKKVFTAKETKTYALAGFPLCCTAGIGGQTFTPPPSAFLASIAVNDAFGVAAGIKTVGHACQDLNGNVTCGETDQGEPDKIFCGKTDVPMPIEDVAPMLVFVSAADTCGTPPNASPAFGTTGTITVTWTMRLSPAQVKKLLAAQTVRTVKGTVTAMVPEGSQDLALNEVNNVVELPDEVRELRMVRAEMCAYSQDPENGQGLFGYVLPVKPTALATVGGRKIPVPVGFTLQASGSFDDDGVQDWDVYFFKALGDCASLGVPVKKIHANASGNERGIIPPDAKWAVFLLWSGAPGSEFTYVERTQVTS